MKTFVALVSAMLCFGSIAHAQSGSASESKGYVEAVVQSAFGNVTSQSFGGEGGVTIIPALQIFLDAGKVQDAATSDLGTNAQTIAGSLAQTQSGVTTRVREPITFGIVGLKYHFVSTGRFEPYVLGGAGLAKVSKEVNFLVGGTDVTANLAQAPYNIVLGTDLSGSETKAMLSLGGGIDCPIWQRIVVDFQYRYGRVLTSGQGINVSRAGVGIGVRF